MFKKLLLLACMGVSASACATPTGLYLMPIADILKHLEGFTFVGLQGNEGNVDPGHSYFSATTIGLFNHGEIGYDDDFRGNTTYNVKLQLFDSPKRLPGSALSVGVINCNGNYREPYVVGRHDFKDFRLHAGYWNTQGCGRLMLGADFKMFNEGTGSIEYLSGPGSITWTSLYYPINAVPGLGIFLSLGVPLDHRDGIQHAAVLLYSFKIK